MYFSSFQQLLEAHETFKQTLPEADKEFNAIMALASEVQRLANQVGLQLTDNPYTTVDRSPFHPTPPSIDPRDFTPFLH